jgi:glycosyltransferase involved in cell wall biosynthesis
MTFKVTYAPAVRVIEQGMHNIWVALLGILAFLWIIAAVRVFAGISELPRLANTNLLPDADCPSVSILISARDEAEGLPQCLTALLAQDYPCYEVIVVNDRSRDATAQILDQFARQNKNLRVIHITELPQGWLGKSYAMVKAHQRATGEWLVFTDADVRFEPDLLRRSLGLVKSKQWDHLSAFFFVDLVGFWEKTAIGWWFLSAVSWIEPWRVSDPKSRRYSGSGAFQLLRRAAYEKIGTHQRLAMEVVEDLKLGKLVKEGGFRSGVALSGDLVRLRWYRGLRGIVRGLSKNSFPACNYNLGIFTLNLSLLFTFHLLPYLVLVFARGLPQALAGVSTLVILIVRLYTDRYYRISPLYALTNPLGAALFFYILLRSALVILRRGGVVWRDTFYPLDELRRGVV